jgi:hypothetical protein
MPSRIFPTCQRCTSFLAFLSDCVLRQGKGVLADLTSTSRLRITGGNPWRKTGTPLRNAHLRRDSVAREPLFHCGEVTLPSPERGHQHAAEHQHAGYQKSEDRQIELPRRPRALRRGFRVAHGAPLRQDARRPGKQRCRYRRESCESLHPFPALPSDNPCPRSYCSIRRNSSNRWLSGKITVIIPMQKMVAGIRVRNSVNRSNRRCMK